MLFKYEPTSYFERCAMSRGFFFRRRRNRRFPLRSSPFVLRTSEDKPSFPLRSTSYEGQDEEQVDPTRRRTGRSRELTEVRNCQKSDVRGQRSATAEDQRAGGRELLEVRASDVGYRQQTDGGRRSDVGCRQLQRTKGPEVVNCWKSEPQKSAIGNRLTEI